MNTLILTPEELTIVREILHHRIANHTVWAFGSRVTGAARKTSDLDLAVISDEPLSLRQYGRLVDDFDLSALPFKVDIVDWASTSPEFRKIIAENKVVIQEKSQK